MSTPKKLPPISGQVRLAVKERLYLKNDSTIAAHVSHALGFAVSAATVARARVLIGPMKTNLTRRGLTLGVQNEDTAVSCATEAGAVRMSTGDLGRAIEALIVKRARALRLSTDDFRHVLRWTGTARL